MILKLKEKNYLDVKLFLEDNRINDLYLTINKEKVYLRNNINFIKKILKNQTVYGIIDNNLKAIMIIYKEKKFRPYFKLSVENQIEALDIIDAKLNADTSKISNYWRGALHHAKMHVSDYDTIIKLIDQVKRDYSLR